jgi:class 3 adenylate cyclase/tetratricopeptide (TPR) repeat protein
MQCRRCHTENPVHARFCIGCGARLTAGCTVCGAELPDGARFCPGCGHPIEPAESTSPLRGPESYTPRHLADKILTSRSALQGERKTVTVLFCDLVSSTALAERLGAEGMHTLLSRFFETALAEVHRYEGTVNQFLGDGFMALFGAPIAHEDHARRAVLAALALRRVVTERPLALESGEHVRIGVRMGVHTGFVVVGAIGDNLRMDYTAIGDTTHLAARLQQMGDPGDILVSDATARLVEGWVALEARGPVSIRGKSDPVVVHAITGTGARRSALERPGAGALSRFVGRDRELDALIDVLAQVEQGRGQVVGIVGEPGVGKSRLVFELGHALRARQVTWFEARCHSYGGVIPYLPVLDLLRAGCGILDSDTPEMAASRVSATLDANGMDSRERAPFLLQLLGLKGDDERLGALGADVLQARTFETLRQMTLASARRRPLALVVEDLHWIDRTSEAFLSSLVESLAGASILLLCTYRPGYRPPWLDKSYATQLAVRQLAAADSLSILHAVIPEVGSASPLTKLILDKAEGNPFFLEELARAVGEHGVTQGGLTVPDTVHGVLMARIDRLPEAAKRLLQTAAVLGREFPARLLDAMSETPGASQPLLDQLARLEFLYERLGGEEPVYVFKHALTQDVAHATLVGSRRRELHRRAAEGLASLYPEQRRDLAPLLAHHYYEAEAWPEVIEPARVAAEAARAAYANQEALARYDQALTAAARTDLEAGARLALFEARADVHAVLGQFEPALADLEAALSLASGAGDAVARGRILGSMGGLWGGHKDYQKGLDLTRQAVAVIETTGDRAALAQARARLGIMLLNLARMRESRSELEQSLTLYRALEDEKGQARTVEMLAMNTWMSGDVSAMRSHAEEAVRRLGAIGDRAAQCSALLTLGTAQAYVGGWSAGEPRLREAIELARVIGARGVEAYAHGLTAECAIPFGRYGCAHREALAGLEMARELGHREWEVLGLAGLGRVHLECGSLVEAYRLHGEMLETARTLGTALWIADALGNLGVDLTYAGEYAAAETHLAEAVEVAFGGAKHRARPLLAQAELALKLGRAEEAIESARRSRPLVIGLSAFPIEARCIEGEAMALLGRHAEAMEVLQHAKAEAAILGAAPVQWRACLVLASLLRREGRRHEALAEAREAAGLLEASLADLDDPTLRRSFERTEAMTRARALQSDA